MRFRFGLGDYANMAIPFLAIAALAATLSLIQGCEAAKADTTDPLNRFSVIVATKNGNHITPALGYAVLRAYGVDASIVATPKEQYNGNPAHFRYHETFEVGGGLFANIKGTNLSLGVYRSQGRNWYGASVRL